MKTSFTRTLGRVCEVLPVRRRCRPQAFAAELVRRTVSDAESIVAELARGG